MTNLIEQIKQLQNSEIEQIITKKIKQFKQIQTQPSNIIWGELCFCLLTANFNAKRAIEIQEKLKDQFETLPQEELAKKLKELGHRFPNKRAEFIYLAREHKNTLKQTLKQLQNDKQRREYLVKNIKGIGMKEASHFLRNIGYLNVAILDFHIIDILTENKIIDKQQIKTLTPKKYLRVETKLEQFTKQLNITQGELDFYLWYLETNTILK